MDMGVKFSQLPISYSVGANDYFAVLTEADGSLKRTAKSTLADAIKIEDLGNTQISNIQNGQVVAWDSTAGKYTNQTIIAGQIPVNPSSTTNLNIWIET